MLYTTNKILRGTMQLVQENCIAFARNAEKMIKLRLPKGKMNIKREKKWKSIRRKCAP